MWVLVCMVGYGNDEMGIMEAVRGFGSDRGFTPTTG